MSERHQHIGPLGSVTCEMDHAEPPSDLVPRPSVADIEAENTILREALVQAIHRSCVGGPGATFDEGVAAAIIKGWVDRAGAGEPT